MANHDPDKKKHKVQRLVDVDVSHVSLVDRPANRTPFKAIKRADENQPEGKTPMNIVLKNMFGSRPAEITSVMADTAVKATAVAKMLMEGEGILSELDGTHIVTKKGHAVSEDDVIVHMGKTVNVAYGVSNLKKELALYDMDSASFDDALKAEGFVPGIYIGMDALGETIRKVAMSEDTKNSADFQKGAATAIADFTKYIDSLIGALPEKAFKFEKAVLSVVSPNVIGFSTPDGEGFNNDVYDALFADEVPVADVAPVDATPTAEELAASEALEAARALVAEADGADTAPVAPVAPEADAEATPAPTAEETAALEATAAPEAAVAAEANPAPANLEELPADTTPAVTPANVMAEMLDALTKGVGDQLTAALGPINERMGKQDIALASLNKAMGSTIASDPEADDTNVIELAKSEAATGGGQIPLMDTAFSTRKG